LFTVADPIFDIKFEQLMVMVGLVEIVIALVCFYGKRQMLTLALMAWMSTNFVVCRPRPVVDGLETSIRLSRHKWVLIWTHEAARATLHHGTQA
jgi:hypothetical protein